MTKYRLGCDDASWFIERLTNPKKAAEGAEARWEADRWYPDLRSAARALLDRLVRADIGDLNVTHAADAAAIVEAVKNAVEQVDQCVDDVRLGPNPFRKASGQAAVAPN